MNLGSIRAFFTQSSRPELISAKMAGNETEWLELEQAIIRKAALYLMGSTHATTSPFVLALPDVNALILSLEAVLRVRPQSSQISIDSPFLRMCTLLGQAQCRFPDRPLELEPWPRDLVKPVPPASPQSILPLKGFVGVVSTGQIGGYISMPVTIKGDIHFHSHTETSGQTRPIRFADTNSERKQSPSKAPRRLSVPLSPTVQVSFR